MKRDEIIERLMSMSATEDLLIYVGRDSSCFSTVKYGKFIEFMRRRFPRFGRARP